MIIEDGDVIVVCWMVFWMVAESLQSKRLVGCTCIGSFFFDKDGGRGSPPEIILISMAL